MSNVLLTQYDVLADFKILERSIVQLVKDYFIQTFFLFGLSYYPPLGPGPRKRLISKKEEKEIVENIAKNHKLTYLQARRRINKAIFKGAYYSARFNELSKIYNQWEPDAPVITTSMIQEYLNKNSKTPNIDFKVMTEIIRRMKSSIEAYVI
jgi:hypothetical protein